MTAPDPTILAAAIKCASEDLHLQRDIDDPEINKVRALVAAAKAYQVMREALEEIARQTLPEDMSVDQQLDADFEGAYGLMIECARAALNPAGPA